jgi:DNA-binding NarL/FixJ family response regulator
MDKSSYRILLADDHAIFRQGMKRLIEEVPALAVVGEARDGRELLNRLQTDPPDLVILDISMPGISGIALIRQIQRRHPGIKVLILTMHRSVEYLIAALEAGAHGYILKEDSDIELFGAIKAVQSDKKYVTGNLAGQLTETLMVGDSSRRTPFQTLTQRERQVLKHIAEGKRNREIAEALKISVRTVENHRAKVMRKLKLGKTADLVKYAIQQGLIELPG